MFELEKGKILEEKKNFKENLKRNAQRAKAELEAIDSKHQNTVEELREMLEEARKETHVNRVDQKKVIRDLEKNLKQEHQRIVDKTNYRVACEVERAQLNNYDKYGHKREQLRH